MLRPPLCSKLRLINSSLALDVAGVTSLLLPLQSVDPAIKPLQHHRTPRHRQSRNCEENGSLQSIQLLEKRIGITVQMWLANEANRNVTYKPLWLKHCSTQAQYETANTELKPMAGNA